MILLFFFSLLGIEERNPITFFVICGVASMIILFIIAVKYLQQSEKNRIEQKQKLFKSSYKGADDDEDEDEQEEGEEEEDDDENGEEIDDKT